MLMTLATLAALTLAQQGETDTTVAVQAGARLDVNNFGGEIAVRTWNQSNVRVRASHSSRSTVEVSTSSGTVFVRTKGRRGPPSIVDLDITVPTWMGMALEGVYTDITVEGAGGPVSAQSVQGEISITGGVGTVAVKAVEGNVTLARTRGRIQVNAVEGDVRISDVVGEVTVETVDGDVTLLRMDSPNVAVGTVDGDIVYDGTIKDGGSYSLATHDGDITVAIPPNASVRLSVASFDGEFDASFPVPLPDARDKRPHRFSITLGTGKARLELETFDGDIRLRRPGELEAPDRDRNKNRNDN
jgi:DUF4097 and DUF4098 domain-containing protein YvlB